MEIEMARPEAVAAARRDRSLVGQEPVSVMEDLQRAGLLGLAAGGVVAPRHEDRQPVVRADPDLVAVNAGVDRPRLLDLLARGHVGIDPVHPDRARIAERDQQVLGGDVGRHVDRPGRQRDRIAVRRQRARRRIDAERRHVMLVAGRAHPRRAVARRDIEMPARGVRPGIMDIGRQCHGAAPDQRSSFDIDTRIGSIRARRWRKAQLSWTRLSGYGLRHEGPPVSSP